MNRQRVIFVTGTLCIVAAAIGFAAGQRGLPSETDVINAGVALYLGETGGSASECVGIPGDGEVWISVVCGDGAVERAYLFDRRGRRLDAERSPKA